MKLGYWNQPSLDLGSLMIRMPSCSTGPWCEYWYSGALVGISDMNRIVIHNVLQMFCLEP